MARLYRGRELIVRQFEAKPKQRGHVYFMQAVPAGLIKIGWTSGHPDVRLKRLRATSPTPIAPLAMMKGSLECECALHSRFEDQWSHGEWFRPESELVEYIESDGEPWPDPVTNHRPLRTQGVDPDIAVSQNEIRQAKEQAREEKRLIKWSKGRTCTRRGVKRTFFEWSELYGIPLNQMWQWKVEGFSVDLIGYYENLKSVSVVLPTP